MNTSLKDYVSVKFLDVHLHRHLVFSQKQYTLHTLKKFAQTVYTCKLP